MTWVVWFTLAAILVVCELASGTFYLLMIALGFAAAGAMALVDLSVPLQFIVGAVVGVVGTYVVNQYHSARKTNLAANANPDINMDIGQTIEVEHWLNGKSRAQYRGADWDVTLDSGANEAAGTFVITAVQGSTLVVRNKTN